MTNHYARSSRRAWAGLAVFTVLAIFAGHSHAQPGPLSFSKSFGPDTIGPGSISTLTFQIDSTLASPVTGLSFTDSLPAGMTIAEPSGLSTSCGASAMLTGPIGANTITLTGGKLPGAGGSTTSCQVQVNVTSSTPGVLTNTSSDLTSDQATAPPATADLTVSDQRPGFSKSFAPDDIVIGSTSTLTFTIDAGSVASNVLNAAFSDPLPAGLTVASPANVEISCSAGTVSAESGATSISLFSGFLQPGEVCTISVDVLANDAAGVRHNLTSDLTSTAGSSGKAGDTINVRIDPLIKRFTDDPVPPGATATLEFAIRNFDRFDSLDDITFTDDLDATLTGMTALGTPLNDVCGAGSELTGSSTLTLTGGSVPPSGECSFSVPVQVPAGATPGVFPNTTSDMSGVLGGSPVNFDPASDDLVIDVFPRMTKTFLPAAVGAGETVDLEFSITNTSQASAATAIGFTDSLANFLNGTSATNLPLNACGGTLQQSATPSGTSLIFSNGSLAASEDCTFTATLQIPAGTPSGQYLNASSDVTAAVDGETRTGPGAVDTLTVLGAPTLTKEFTDDPVDPGDTVTLEFTLTHDEFAPANAVDIALTDDLDAALAGLVAVGLPLNDVCGPGSSLSGAANLSLTSGTLAPGETCTFSATLQVPAGAPPGVHSNTTSDVTATVSGQPTTGRSASDSLLISGLEASKTFLDFPVIPGQTTTLEFTLTNDNPTLAATNIAFSDNLDAVLSGLAATGLPADGFCGAGSTVTGTGNLVITGGNLAPESSCTFGVTLQVPAGASPGNYDNFTSTIQATYDGANIAFPPAAATLEIDNNIIGLAKSFVDDPVAPGGPATLEFTLTNASASEAVTDITFTDDLDAVLAGLTSTSGTQSDVCGAGSQLAGTSLLTLTGASLPPSGSCTFSATLAVPASVPGATNFINTTSDANGLVGGIPVFGNPAIDELLINLVGFSKSFDSAGTPGGTVGLTFTLENQGTTAVAGLAFTDNLDAMIPGLVATGLPQAGICGKGSQVSGSSVTAFSGGELPPGESCSFQIDLAIPGGVALGSYLNTTSNLTSGGLMVASAANATLGIEPPPTFAKAFAPALIGVDEVTTLTFTIDNSAGTLIASNLAFSDALPAGTEVAAVPNVVNTCAGTLAADGGSDTISLIGGTVAAAAICTISVDVTATAEGNFTNVSGELTSSSGNSGTATDTLEAVGTTFEITKAFASQPVLPGGRVDLVLTVSNDSSLALENVALTDDLDAVLPGLVAEGLPLADACGAGSQVSGTTVISLTGGTVPANSDCTVVIPVRLPGDAQAGSFANTTSVATATRQGVDAQAPAASANLVVDVLQFAKSISPQNAAAGSSIDITFEFTNPDPVNTAEGLSFSDDLDAFVPGMTSSDAPQNDVCGAGSLLDGSDMLTLTGGSVPPSGSCTITVTADIPTDTQAGDYTNVTSVVTGNVEGLAFEGAEASASLGIQTAPTFAKSFEAEQLGPGQSSTLTFTIDNEANSLPADDLAFVDPLPAGMQVASSPNIVNNCGGVLTADAGSTSISLNNGSLAAGASCTISVDVVSSVAGSLTNVTDDLTSSLGNSGSATATLVQFISVPVTDRYWMLVLMLLLTIVGWIHIRRT